MTKQHSLLPILHFFNFEDNTRCGILTDVTGCILYDLIYLEGDYTHQSYQQGYKWQEYSPSTRNTLAILYRGDVQFWLGVRDTPINYSILDTATGKDLDNYAELFGETR